MSIFYFHVVTPAGLVSDIEGTELPSLEAARLEAIEDARALMSAAIREGHDISSRTIKIADESGSILLSVNFSDAVRPEA